MCKNNRLKPLTDFEIQELKNNVRRGNKNTKKENR